MKKLFCLVAASGLLFAACSKKDTVITKIGKDKVTLSMVEERIKEAPPAYQSYLDTTAGRKQFLDLIVRERLVLENARQAGFTKNQEYTKALSDFKKDQSKRLKDYEENLLMELYVRDIHEKFLNASDAEISKYYNDHESEFKRPLEVTAQHILLPTKEEAEKALKRVQGGENFAKVAKEVSTDPMSAPRGGEIGPFRKGELVPEFENAVFPLKLGQVSGIVETQFGFHIVKKTQEKVLPGRSLEDAKGDIKRIVEKEKFDKWLEEAKRKMGVNVDYNALSLIPPVYNANAQAAQQQNNKSQVKTQTNAVEQTAR